MTASTLLKLIFFFTLLEYYRLANGQRVRIQKDCDASMWTYSNSQYDNSFFSKCKTCNSFNKTFTWSQTSILLYSSLILLELAN